ncbi:MAG: tandem-95 repeat protein, partial [Gammaproteobacteria bacterium]|nr:tandem-95 repeat protein [Gammaproteobacteria bacterium]
SYQLDISNLDVQVLPEGETLTDSFTVNSFDGTGSQVVEITITGINGEAIITGTSIADTNEDSTTQITGSLLIADEDSGEAIFVQQTNLPTTYGIFSIDTTGNWTYTLDNTNAYIQALASNETVTDIITVASADGTEKEITITITGVNDTATITGTSTGDINEDDVTAITGSLAVDDEDSGEAIFEAQTGVVGDYGTFNIDSQGVWTFDLDIENSLVQQMSSTEQVTDSFTVMSIDGTDSQVVIVTINGANDAPNAEHDEIILDFNTEGLYIIDVLANDSDIDGDTLTLIGASADIGSVTIEDNKLVYQQHTSIQGTIQLSYTVKDDSEQANSTSQGTVELIINSDVDTEALLPVITLPADIDINADALFTKVDLGVATAVDKDGEFLPVLLVDGITLFKPGNNVAYWKAIDEDGFEQIALQNVIVHPLISISNDKQAVEGNDIVVGVHLNGVAPNYPITIPYQVSGSVDSNDHSLISGELVITEGLVGYIELSVYEDDLNENEETLTITLDSSLNLGARSSFNLSIVEDNIAPQVDITVMQGSENRLLIERDQQTVTVQAFVTDGNNADTHSYLWSFDDDLIADVDSKEDSFTFETTDLTLGTKKLTLTVTDNGDLSTTVDVYLEVVEELPTLTDVDTDGDLIPDNQEGFGDTDADGIPDYLDVPTACNIMPEQTYETDRFLVEGELGVCLRKGVTVNGNTYNSITLETSDLLVDEVAVNVGGIFDFIAYGLPTVGQSYNIVLPQIMPIPENALYRKYTEQQGWFDFIIDDNNYYSSSKGESGYCPSPLDDSWVKGLTSGHWCVQLTIEDGGLNDNDGLANGTIADPGGVAVAISTNNAPTLNDAEQIEMAWNTVQEIDVLQNATDVDGDLLTIVAESVSVNFGEVSIDGDMLTYTPATNFLGVATIYYGVSDGVGTAYATVSVNVVNNQLPEAYNDTVSTDNLTSVTIDVLSNDINFDVNDTLTVISAVAQYGSVVINTDNTLTYTPKSDFTGIDIINYTIDDGNNGQSSALVVVNVTKKISVDSGGSMGYLSLLFGGLLLVGRKLKMKKIKKFFRQQQ